MDTINGYWYIAAAGSELKEKPIKVKVEGESLVLWRDRAGKPQALRDRCAHRGMALSAGKVVDGCIQCPYHGYTYDGEGRLKDIPSLCSGERLPKVKSMKSLAVIEQQEQLWVWIGEKEPTREPFEFPHYGEKGWTTFFMQTRFHAPVDMCLENFLDVPHTVFVHPGLFRNEDQDTVQTRVTRSGESVVVTFLDEKPMEGIGPRLVFPKGVKQKHTDRFILPSISRVDYKYGNDHQFLIVSQCTQREEFVVDVTTAITWNLPLPSLITRPFLKWYCRKVIQQDVDILEIQGAQMKEFGRNFTHTKVDLLGRHINALRRNAAKGSPELKEISQEVSIRI
jgi:phenylpropionate dioxygenase-like ring-hydroxylating dioxygenase large terminal subunit